MYFYCRSSLSSSDYQVKKKNTQRRDTGILFEKRSFKTIIAFVVMQPWKWLGNVLPAWKLTDLNLAQSRGFCCSARHMKQRHRNTENH